MCRSLRQQHIIAHEAAQSGGAALFQNGLVCVSCIEKPCQRGQCCGLFGCTMLRAVLQQTGTVGLCLLGKCFLAKRTEDPAACPRRKNVQRLDPHVDCCGIALRRPVQKPVFRRTVLSVRTDMRGQIFRQLFEIGQLPGQIRPVAELHIVIMLNDDPPHGIGRDIVHPLIGRCLRRYQIQTVTDDLLVAEDGLDGREFWVQISDPYQPVALDAVPDILLHIKMDGISAGLPDPVQKRVAAGEASEIRNIAV